MASVDLPNPIAGLQLQSLRLSEDAPQLLELEWHPTRALLATADVQGAVCFNRVARPTPRAKRGAVVTAASAAANAHEVVARLEYHTESCRSIAFHPQGAYAYTASADKSIGIIDLSTLTLSSQLHNAHSSGINCLAFYDENMLISGDDDGFVHVWDLRAHNMSRNAAAAAVDTTAAGAGARAAMSAKAASSVSSKPHGSVLYPLLRYEDAGDYITDLLPVPDKNRLVVTSGDGHLYVYDMRAGHIHEKVAMAHGRKAQPKPKPLGKSKAAQNKKLTPSGQLAASGHATDTWSAEHTQRRFAMSDDVEDELSGALLLKRGRKLVCAGREEGVLNIFKWDYFGVAQDHFSLGAAGNDMEGSGASVDCMLKIDEDTILTGSTDGLIRLVQLHPNKLLSILGTHDDFPIECMRMSPDRPQYFDMSMSVAKDEDDDDEDDEEGAAAAPSSSSFVAPAKNVDTDAAAEVALGLTPRFLASSSHDNVVKFWNCSELYEVDPDEEKPEEEDSSDEEGGAEKAGSGSDDEDDDEDDDEKAAEKDAEKSMAKGAAARSLGAKRKRESIPPPAKKKETKKEEDDDEDGEDEDEEGADDEEEGAGSDSDSGAGMSDDSDSQASGKEGDEKEEDEEDEKEKKPKVDVNPFAAYSLSSFARLAPAAPAAPAASPASSSSAIATAAATAASLAAAAAATALAPSAPTAVTNKWLLVAPTTAAPAAPAAAASSKAGKTGAAGGKSGAGSKAGGSDSGSDGESDDGGRRKKPRSDRDLNADTSFFEKLPVTHPMHPSQQHKRATKAPLRMEVDNIALRPAKKRAALQEKLKMRAERKARLEARKAEALAKGEDPELVESSEEEQKGKGGGKRGKGGNGAKRTAGSDDSDDSDADSDDSDAKPKAKKERKLTAKEKKAIQKAERKKNPFFSGL